MVDIRLPNITGKTDSEQLAQIKSYLYQFIPQLQWALSNIQSDGSSSVVVQQSEAFATGTKNKPLSDMNFNELKSLIIKSADIVEAFYDEITTLIDSNSRYAAHSEFGSFVEQTELTLYGGGEVPGVKEQIENVQQIFDEDGNIKAERLVNGHIFSGIIEYAKDGGEAIIGIEIGQTTKTDGVETFNKFARFTADRLSFYDINSTEVAYISDYMMVITNAWVKGSLQIGIEENGFIFDTSYGIALRPV